MHCFISLFSMRCIAISIAKHSHRGVTQPACRTDDSARNFSTIRDQDF